MTKTLHNTFCIFKISIREEIGIRWNRTVNKFPPVENLKKLKRNLSLQKGTFLNIPSIAKKKVSYLVYFYSFPRTKKELIESKIADRTRKVIYKYIV